MLPIVISPETIEFALFALMLGVEVSGIVLLVVHPDDDSEEH